MDKSRWEYKKLGEVCDFQGGSQPPKSEWSKEPRDGYVRMLHIRDFTQNATDYIEYVKKSKSLKYCKDDDILIGRYGASVGKILTGLSGAYNVAIIKSIPMDIVDKRYLKYYFLSPYFQHNLLATSQHRAAQAGFSKEDIFDYKFLCPFLSEQQHIVEELDLLSSIIEKKKAQLFELDNLAQSLFYEMFGDPITNEKGWEVKKLSDICVLCQGLAINAKSKHLLTPSGELPLLHIKDMKEGTREIFVNTNECPPNCIANIDDIIYTRTGTLGLVFTNMHGVLHNNCFKINIDKTLLSKVYIMFYIGGNDFRSKIIEQAKRSSQPDITHKLFLSQTIVLPPLSLQQSFAEKIEAIEHQKELIKQSIKEVETLFNNRMDYYFN